MTPAAGLFGIAAMLAAIFLLGLSPGPAMALVGFAGLLLMRDTVTLADLFAGTAGLDFWDVFSNYGFTVIPLFVLLGEVIFYAGYSDRLFAAAQTCFGHRRGGLAITTIFACAGFSSICGSNTAAAATLSAVALPAMEERGYHPRLKTGAVAAGSTLGAMIPPSIVLVVYGLNTGQSVGKLFAGSIVPGLLLTLLFALTVAVICLRHPDWAPAAAPTRWRARLRAIPLTLDVAVLFGVVMTALFSGKITPTEAAGVGSLLAVAVCVFRGHLSRKAFARAAGDTLRITGMVFLLLAGATLFGRFLTRTGLPAALTESVAAAHLPGAAVFALMILCYLAGGCVMDALAFLLIALPLFMPLVSTLGLDPIWFGQVLCLVTTLGAVTPPIGVSCFVVAGMSRGKIGLHEVFRGAFLFYPAYLATLVLLLLFPHATVGWLAALVR